jgi:hypothetical protein
MPRERKDNDQIPKSKKTPVPGYTPERQSQGGEVPRPRDSYARDEQKADAQRDVARDAHPNRNSGRQIDDRRTGGKTDKHSY